MESIVGLKLDVPEQLQCLLAALGDAVDQTAAQTGSWGIGFYQQGEFLLKKQPVHQPTPLAELVKGIQTTALISQLRETGGRPFRFDDTHPYRFRNWLFGHVGSVVGFDSIREKALDYVPSYVQQNILGSTDSELLFHLFLAFVHDAGQIDARWVQSQVVRHALTSTVQLTRRLLSDAGVSTAPVLNMLATNGEMLLGVRHGLPMLYRNVDAIEQCLVCSAEPDVEEPISHHQLQACVIVSGDLPPGRGWCEVPEMHVLEVDESATCHMFPVEV